LILILVPNTVLQGFLTWFIHIEILHPIEAIRIESIFLLITFPTLYYYSRRYGGGVRKALLNGGRSES